MPNSPKTPPRFLPTLTEVVTQPQSEKIALAAMQAPEELPPPDAQLIIERVMQQLEPLLQVRLREVISAMVDEQMQALEPRLLQEVEQSLRASVAQAVAGELEAWPHKSVHD